MAIQIILLYLPLVYLASNTVYYLYKWKTGYKESDANLSQSYIDILARVLDSTTYSEFDDGKVEEQYELYTDKKVDKKF